MKWRGAQVKRIGLDGCCRPRLDEQTGCNQKQPDNMGVRVFASFVAVCVAAILTAGCISDGGGEPDLAAAIPSDTYETCRGGGALNEGVNFLSSGGGAGRVKLGMSECALIQVLGNPVNIAPGIQPAAGRQVSMIYANPDGTSTSYLFVNNALREMNLVSQTPQAQQTLPGAPPPG